MNMLKLPARYQFDPVKIFRHLDRLEEFAIEGWTTPVTAELDPTNRCNLHCPWCSAREEQSRSQAQMSKDELKLALDEIRSIGVRGVTFTGGGEPLVNPHTPWAVTYARSIGLDVGFITNGTMLDEEIAQIIVENCVWTRVSLDSIFPMHWETWGKGGKAQLQNALAGVRNLVRAKMECRSDTTIGVQFLIKEENVDDIPIFAHAAHVMGVDYCQFTPVVVHVGDQLPPELWEKAMILMRQTEDENDKDFKVIPTWHKFIDLMSPESNYGRNYKRCYGAWFTTVVGADLTVWLCCHTRGHMEFALGNLREQRFKEIWGSKRHREILDNLDLSLCQPCCRNHEINKLLWRIKHEVRHLNFL